MRYKLNSFDRQMVDLAGTLLRRAIAADLPTPAELVSLGKVLHALDRMPQVSDVGLVSVEIGSSGESWTITIDRDGRISVDSGGCESGVGGSDSYSNFHWEALPDEESNFIDYLFFYSSPRDAEALMSALPTVEDLRDGAKLYVLDPGNALLETPDAGDDDGGESEDRLAEDATSTESEEDLEDEDEDEDDDDDDAESCPFCYAQHRTCEHVLAGFAEDPAQEQLPEWIEPWKSFVDDTCLALAEWALSGSKLPIDEMSQPMCDLWSTVWDTVREEFDGIGGPERCRGADDLVIPIKYFNSPDILDYVAQLLTEMRKPRFVTGEVHAWWASSWPAIVLYCRDVDAAIAGLRPRVTADCEALENARAPQ